MRTLKDAGYAIMVASNQSGIARGYFRPEEMRGVARRLERLVRAQGAELEAFCYCPHHPAGCVAEFAVACECRKPQPGLLLEAAANRGLCGGALLDGRRHPRRRRSRAARRHADVLIANGNETEWQRIDERVPDYVAADLAEAARLIVCADAAAKALESEALA